MTFSNDMHQTAKINAVRSKCLISNSESEMPIYTSLSLNIFHQELECWAS
uniref:Uncharacterized protein n=1 Tax=Anguilla anguilla TaxID=7936 RepID=A0A0E9X5S5_ANGAN